MWSQTGTGHVLACMGLASTLTLFIHPAASLAQPAPGQIGLYFDEDATQLESYGFETWEVLHLFVVANPSDLGGRRFSFELDGIRDIDGLWMLSETFPPSAVDHAQGEFDYDIELMEGCLNEQGLVTLLDLELFYLPSTRELSGDVCLLPREPVTNGVAVPTFVECAGTAVSIPWSYEPIEQRCVHSRSNGCVTINLLSVIPACYTSPEVLLSPAAMDPGSEASIPLTLTPFSNGYKRETALFTHLELEVTWPTELLDWVDFEPGSSLEGWEVSTTEQPGGADIVLNLETGDPLVYWDEVGTLGLRSNQQVGVAGVRTVVSRCDGEFDPDFGGYGAPALSRVFVGCERGDALDDDQLDVGDVIKVLRLVVGMDPMEFTAYCAADVDEDALVTIADAIRLLQHIVGLEKGRHAGSSQPSADAPATSAASWYATPRLELGVEGSELVLEVLGVAGLELELHASRPDFEMRDVATESGVAAVHSSAPGVIRLAWVSLHRSQSANSQIRLPLDPGAGGLALTVVGARVLDSRGTEAELALEGSTLVFEAIPSTPPRTVAQVLPNFPNPFNPSTRIPFVIGERGAVSLTIHDAAGRLVRRFSWSSLDAGEHAADWDGLDETGSAVGSGVYFVRLHAGDEISTRPIALLR